MMDAQPALPTRFSAQEALVCAMVLMGVSDRGMTDAELATMSRLVRELPDNGASSLIASVCSRRYAGGQASKVGDQLVVSGLVQIGCCNGHE